MPVAYSKNTRRGFGLLEIIVSIAIFTMFAIGVYSGIQFVFRLVYQSRLRILETAILNEHVEIIRNMPFEDIGIVNGSPAGVLERETVVTRNGIAFTLTKTIRNIDDPFDGTIGGDPNDTSPADYKLVDISIICTSCGQRQPISVTTFISPKYLEGDPTNGALFIEVFDATPLPVAGATVHVVASSTDPAIDITDTTDNDGMLRIIDLPAGIQAYHITVTKNGYTSEGTLAPTEEIPNPTKLPASVIAQDVTSISFSIDEIATLEIATQNASCQPVGDASLHVLGTKRSGTEPDTFLVDDDITTNAGGLFSMTNLVWDAYGIQTSGYDAIGTIPSIPIQLFPGVTQPVTMVLGPNTANSVIVHVMDSVTEQPVSSATVTVTANGYNQSKITGVGSVGQTDWSGGNGQTIMQNETQYALDDGGIETTDDPGNITLRELGGLFVPSGVLESSTFDLGVSANFVNIIWEPLAQPVETGEDAVSFQLATSNTSTPDTWEYIGPDGTANTYYTSNAFALSEEHANNQYVRYKAFLETETTTSTPTLSEVSLTYTTSCTPPGQTYFGNLTSGETYVVTVSRDGYEQKQEEVVVDGDMIVSVLLESE
ncbi:MAG: prepilin-type N-terminal cleavage/methylation domain-containing protein [Candidatus Magasanikbacteria bacterium]|nr:prepilin-type N-terminal cleavage/methylation domain-containing protein [Candidatus Magasanikbacteria bacterium]